METSEKLFGGGNVFADILAMAVEARELQKYRLRYEYEVLGLQKESAVVFDKYAKLRS